MKNGDKNKSVAFIILFSVYQFYLFIVKTTIIKIVHVAYVHTQMQKNMGVYTH